MRDNIERISAEAAMQRARRNDLRRYPAPDRDAERLYPLASPEVRPGFTIARSDTVYAIGSCFARNVEKALAEAGLRVLSREFDLGEIGASLEDGANFFNKYSIHSVVNELRWAFERATFPGAALLYPLGGNRHVDAQLGMARLDFDIDTILAFRHRYLDALAQVREADVIVLTLGYVETWFDRHLGLYLNVAPPQQAIKADPERFEFRVLSYRDVLAGLEELHALLVRHRTKPLKMLVTVSPVPLLSTFRDMDVLVANAYSKSVQRAALDEFVLGREGVDYFPSYEFVTLSNPAVAWSRADFRHVSQDVITRIMESVLSRYVPAGGDDGRDAAAGDGGGDGGGEGADSGVAGGSGALARGGLLSTLRMLAKLERFEDMLTRIDENRALADGNPDALLFEAMAQRRLERHELAYDALHKARDLAPDRAEILERMIVQCRPMRRLHMARALLAEHEAAFPDRAEFRARLGWLGVAG